MRLLLLILLVSGCESNEVSKIVFRNESNIGFDSLKVSVNNYGVYMYGIGKGTTDSINIETDSVNADHDVIYSFELFLKDSIFVKKRIFSNDLGYIPKEFRVKLTDRMKIEQY